MEGSTLLKGKRILAVDDERDVLESLEEEILDACPDCVFEKAVSYEEALALMEVQTYDIIILDIMGVRGFDLLEKASEKGARVAMLTAHALTPEALRRSYELRARAFLPKDKLGEIVPFLEDILQYDFRTGWNRLFEKLRNFFNARFESDWERRTGLPWREWVK